VVYGSSDWWSLRWKYSNGSAWFDRGIHAPPPLTDLSDRSFKSWPISLSDLKWHLHETDLIISVLEGQKGVNRLCPTRPFSSGPVTFWQEIIFHWALSWYIFSNSTSSSSSQECFYWHFSASFPRLTITSPVGFRSKACCQIFICRACRRSARCYICCLWC